MVRGRLGMSYAQDADRIMFINEVKKALYKQKLPANLVSKHAYIWQYQSFISVNDKPFVCNFSVPVSDMGDAVFTNSIPAQLLIRYLDIL